MDLRSTTAAVAIAAFVAGLTAAYGSAQTGPHYPTPTEADARTGAGAGKNAPASKCASERECYDRIAACIARGGEWRGNEKAGRCHRGTG